MVSGKEKEMRYRIHFTAKKDADFHWETSDILETNDLLQLIFQFQIIIANEYKRIIEESKKVPYDDDIPF